MDYARFSDKLIIRMDPGEEVLEQLEMICKKEGIKLAEVKALGALNNFTVGLYDTAEKKYHYRAIVSATIEMVVTVFQGKVERYHDDEVGLNLLKFRA